MKPYYQDDYVTIYNANCYEILKDLPKCELLLTDPPYGISHPTDYKTRRRGGITECRNDYAPVTGDDEPFDPTPFLGIADKHIFWGANYFANKLPNVSGWLVWDKMRPDELDQATCELAWSDCVKGVRRFRQLWNGCMRQKDKGEEYVHPTQKSLDVMRWCLSLKWTKGVKTVIDPFGGSGTTGRAAKDLGIKCILIEIEEPYCEISANRMRQEVLAL